VAKQLANPVVQGTNLTFKRQRVTKRRAILWLIREKLRILIAIILSDEDNSDL
jgi:hypothetical protein